MKKTMKKLILGIIILGSMPSFAHENQQEFITTEANSLLNCLRPDGNHINKTFAELLDISPEKTLTIKITDQEISNDRFSLVTYEMVEDNSDSSELIAICSGQSYIEYSE